MAMTAIKEMTLDQLRTELLFATRMLELHRKGVHGSCLQRCEEDHPCATARSASAKVREVAEALADRRDRIAQASIDLDWR